MSVPQALVIERVIAHPVEKIWRALTVAEFVGEWLMKNDFELEVGHTFTFRAQPVPGWKGYTNCTVLEIEPLKKLVYTWGDGTESDNKMQTVVTWTLEPAAGGTLVRMTQTGFKAGDEGFLQGASQGWTRMLAGLERTAGKL